MTMRGLEKLARLVGVLGVLVVVIAVWAGVEMSFKHSVGRPVLQLEIADSPAAFAAVLEGDAGNVAQARRQIEIDWFFIAAYWLFFLGLAALLSELQPPASRWTGAVAAVIATAGASFDLAENRGILAALDAYSGGNLSLELVRHTREVSLLKWALLFAVLMLLAGVFLAAAGWRRFVGLLVAASSAVGLAGVCCRALPGELTLITIGATLVFLVQLPLLVELVFRPQRFVLALPASPARQVLSP